MSSTGTGRSSRAGRRARLRNPRRSGTRATRRDTQFHLLEGGARAALR